MYKVYQINKKDKDYPKKFLELKSPPKMIYVIGNLKLLNRDSVVIVGSRDSTLYGERQAKKIAKELSENGITIVSGLAKGIDSVAHINSMREKGKTIAVIASGFNHIYPEENILLAKEIIENGGTIISQYPPDTEVDLKKFPKRNNLIAALGRCTIVVEAKARSGSGITARKTMEQKKPVFCLPGRVEDKNGRGTNNLIKKGAYIYTDIRDIYEMMGIDCLTRKVNRIKSKYIKKVYKDIYKLIEYKPKSKNEIAKELNIEISELNTKITLMELDGLIDVLPR